MILPIFSSNHSVMSSIFTIDPTENELDESSPLSIFTIGKKHGLKDIYLLDTSYSSFPEAYKSAEKDGFNLKYGVSLYCCPDITRKDEESTNFEHKINLWAGSTAALKPLQKIYSKAFTDGFYYHGRIDFKTINEMWHEDIILTIPFYDSFLFQNLMFFNKNIVPEWGALKPIFFMEFHELPFDSIIQEGVKNYCSLNNFEIQEVSSVYYYKNSDFYQYQVLRCISGRTKMSRPNLNFMASDKFSFEYYLNQQ